ncbi:hypothetical protein ACRRS0_12350 [Agarivorans sp. QJM3NY_29]|uniref:hypothetical protein n=1 Tax=unclassified Agarivorans TaxID=2636026 RepID=UPI003D7E59FB
MKKLTLASLLLIVSYSAMADLEPQLLTRYFQAAQGDYSELEQLYQEMQTAQQGQPGDAWALFYLGATETLKGDDAWLPWRKLNFTADGLARMDKALNMIGPNHWQQQYRSLPQALYMQAMAAITYSSVPQFFNYQERGFELFRQVLADPQLLNAPVQASTWIYSFAIETALKQDQQPLAQAWLKQLRASGIDDSYSQQAEQLYAQYSKR